MRNVKINESGHIVVKNLSAWWIPEIKVEREMHSAEPSGSWCGDQRQPGGGSGSAVFEV